MNKRVISLLSCVILMAFLCSFNVFATSSTGKTITSTSTSYNNGDVTLYTRVNGKYSNNSPGNNAFGIYYYEHNFTVTLANNTNEFQVADTNTFSIDLYTGYTDTFSTSGTRPSWGNYVTSYSDNMSIPRVIQHNSGNLSGHVIITFQDSDLLVLNPNETREYNFSIMFTQDYDSVQQSVINGDVIVSYFTYTGTVSMYSKPSSFTSNTINDFMNNNSLPNSVIAWLMANYTALSEDPAYQNFYNGYSQGLNSYSGNKNFSRATSAYGEYLRINNLGFRIVSSDYDIYNVVNGTNYGNRDIIGAYDLYINYQLYSTGDYDVIVNPANAIIEWIPTVNLNGWTSIGAEYSVLESNGFQVLFCTPWAYDSSHQLLTIGPSGSTHDTGRARMATLDPAYITVKITYYFLMSDTDLSTISQFPAFTNLAIANFNTKYNSHTVQSYTTHSIQWYLRNWWESYTKPDNTGSEDQINDAMDQEDTIHTQEQTWYTENQNAIEATGLSNYEFTNNQLSGLGVVKSQFTSVWQALGDWSLIYVFVLMLSLATFVIRHEPTTAQKQRASVAEDRYQNSLAWKAYQRDYYESVKSKWGSGSSDGDGSGDLMQNALRKYK